MNLIDLFDKASESPEFIPKLRQLILDLAVCGKLVSQNPKDEPAAELLKRIENEKSILLKNGIIKKSEAVRPSCGKNINLELPNGWSPTNLQMLCISISDGDHQPPPKAEEGVPFLVIGNVRTQTLDFAGCRHVTQEYYNSLDSIRRPQKHDILYTLVGSWSLKKYELVKNYARIFSTSMKNKWDCRVYIDLYAGAGYSKIRDNLKIVQASPLLAVDIPDRFDKYIFCEIDKEKIEALKVRVERDFKNIDANYINLDANASVDNVLNLIPAYSKNFKVLCFCFVDVYKASDFNFKTIKRLSQRYMDFLILIPTNMDILRNEKNYIEEESSVIDNFLDDKTWREEWKKDKSKGTSFGLYIAELFCKKMSELGYIPDLENSVLIKYPEKNVPLYRLVFFSRHKLGSHFWKDVKQYSDPQLNLGF